MGFSDRIILSAASALVSTERPIWNLVALMYCRYRENKIPATYQLAQPDFWSLPSTPGQMETSLLPGPHGLLTCVDQACFLVISGSRLEGPKKGS